MAKKANRQAYINVQAGVKQFKEEVAQLTEALKVKTNDMKTSLNSDDNAVYMEADIKKFINQMNVLINDAAGEEKYWENRRKAIFKEN